MRVKLIFALFGDKFQLPSVGTEKVWLADKVPTPIDAPIKTEAVPAKDLVMLSFFFSQPMPKIETVKINMVRTRFNVASRR